MAAIVTSGDKIMLYRATRQPLKGIYCIPSGKMRYGDDLPTSLARELERRQITDQYSASFLCQTNVRFMRGNEVIIHRPGVLWHVEYDGELQATETQNGISEWFDTDKVSSLQPITPEIAEALARIKSKSHEPIDIVCKVA